MSNSVFRADVKEDDDNDDDDGDRISDQQQLELRKEEEEFIENIVEGDDKKDEESINTTSVTADEDVEKRQQQQLGEGLSSTEDDDNDGFRTPTSIEHRIPVPTQCPPAPRKSFKRKFEESSIVDIIRSATKAVHDHIMAFKKARQDDDALS